MSSLFDSVQYVCHIRPLFAVREIEKEIGVCVATKAELIDDFLTDNYINAVGV